MGWMRMFTVLADPGRGCRGGPAGGWGGEARQRQHLVGVHDPRGERRLLFGVGEGLAEAKQGRASNTDRLRPGGQLAWESRSWKMVPVDRESASLLRQSPVVNHLLFTCNSTC